MDRAFDCELANAASTLHVIVIAGKGYSDGASAWHSAIEAPSTQFSFLEGLVQLARHPRVATISVSIEHSCFPALAEYMWNLVCRPHLRVVPASVSLVESAIVASNDLSGPILVVGASEVMLAACSIDAMGDALADADLAVALVRPRASSASGLQAAFGLPGFLHEPILDQNLFGVGSPQFLPSARFLVDGGQAHLPRLLQYAIRAICPNAWKTMPRIPGVRLATVQLDEMPARMM